MDSYADTTAASRQMELEWNDLAVILAVCRSGTLSGAARMLGLNHSTIFRKINAIEEKTGVRFFERLPHGYAMTEAGETAMRYAERVENEVHALGREVLGRDMRLQGRILVTAPEGVATKLVPPALAEFCDANPDISVDLNGTSTDLDLARREADIALRVTARPPDSSLGRRICDFRFCVYASRGYMDRYGGRALQDHRWIMTLSEIDWLIPLVWKNRPSANSRIVFASSVTAATMSAAKEGIGVVMAPCFLGDAESGLVRVTDPLESLTRELWVLTHPDLRYTARVKALMTHLYDSLRKKRRLIEGAMGTEWSKDRPAVPVA